MCIDVCLSEFNWKQKKSILSQSSISQTEDNKKIPWMSWRGMLRVTLKLAIKDFSKNRFKNRKQVIWQSSLINWGGGGGSHIEPLKGTYHLFCLLVSYQEMTNGHPLAAWPFCCHNILPAAVSYGNPVTYLTAIQLNLPCTLLVIAS